MLRAWCESDVESLVAIANDADIARFLRDRFPHPYTQPDALGWIAACLAAAAPTHFAIEVQGELAGGVGFDPFSAERRHTARIGYWLGRRFWGRGIATHALRACCEFVFSNTGILRVEADVYAPNRASMRVLEKNGFSLEGKHRLGVCKGEEMFDVLMFAKLRSDACD